MIGHSSGFRSNVSFVERSLYSLNLSLRRRLVSPVYCRLQILRYEKQYKHDQAIMQSRDYKITSGNPNLK